MADLSNLMMTIRVVRRPWWDIARRLWRGLAAYRMSRRGGVSREEALGNGWFVAAYRIQLPK